MARLGKNWQHRAGQRCRMRLAVMRFSLSAEHSRAFDNRTCEKVVRTPWRAQPSRYPPGQLAILELDQSTSTQVINTAIGVLLFAGLIHFPRNSCYVRQRKLFRWRAGPCFSVTRLFGILRKHLPHLAGQRQSYFRKTLQPISSIEHGLSICLFLALQQAFCDES